MTPYRSVNIWQVSLSQDAPSLIDLTPFPSAPTATKNPDVVLASAGDYVTQEAIYAVKLCKELAPELKVRYVNVSELTSMGLGDNYKGGCNSQAGVEKYFTKNKPVVFSLDSIANPISKKTTMVFTASSGNTVKRTTH